MDIAFGPVPSRRLGRSLGINNIPPKHCSYSCVYCQVGVTHGLEIAPREFYPPSEIRRQVGLRLDAVRARGEAVDWLTFVPDGEPTLDRRLGEAIDALRDLGPPIAVISNASLLWRPETRAALGRADWVSVKVDSVDEAVWRRLNRPHPALELEPLLDGLRAFVREFGGTLVSETLLARGFNDDPQGLEAVGRFLAGAGIHRAYLAIPHRPPAIAGISGPDETVLIRAHQILSSQGLAVELLTGYEGDVIAHGGDLEEELLAITAVHPLRQSALDALLAKAGADQSVVERLLREDRLRRVDHAGTTFYLRRLPRG
jgi:wyosine [tRNA(Phe)-imidazoG37] synthetase (radical SAM superfamily)